MTEQLKKYRKDLVNLFNEDGGGTTTERKDKTYVGGDDITRPLTYTPPTDEELLNVAKASYKTAKDQSVKSAVDEADRKKKSLYESINDQIEGAEVRKQGLNESYDSAQKNLENQTLKRGIQRSSAVIGGLKGLETEKLNAINKMDSETKAYVDKLNKEIYDLESDLGKELSSINEKYENAVQVRLHELKKERDDKINEVIKYNNSLDLFYTPDQYVPGEDGTTQYPKEVDMDEVKPRYRERIYEVLNDYVSIEDPAEALALYETNESVKHYLGKYYEYVHKLLENRKNTAV